ncbi:MFS transporter [Microbispora sp. CA-135349]|uniref:MFS transporter n=1 Tax=Microbispora sp. CA-135349 TaxID=3239953 RepID=UPI003D92322C
MPSPGRERPCTPRTPSPWPARRLPPERSGRATATVVGGLTTAIVAGLPLGAWLGAHTGWRPTLWVVVALAVVAAAGVASALPRLPGQAVTSLRARLAPLTRLPVLTTLMATWLCLSTSWTVYNYVDQITREATGGDAARTSFVLLSFGVGAVAGNLLTGRLADRLGPARTIGYAAPLLVLAAAAAALLSATFLVALALAAVWGLFHWTVNVPQQLRVVAAAPRAAPVVLGLHQSTIYIGIGTGGVAGAAGFTLGDAHGVGYAALVVGVLALAALAVSLRINKPAVVAGTPPKPAARVTRAT